jgi:hypothetical protein
MPPACLTVCRFTVCIVTVLQAGGSVAPVPANATTFAKVEEFLTPQNLAVFVTLLLTADYSISAAEWGQQRYDLQRNLTIASAPGFEFFLEFDYISQALRVPTGVTVTLQDLAIGKDRQPPGWSVPFFIGAAVAATSSSRRVAEATKAAEAAAEPACDNSDSYVKQLHLPGRRQRGTPPACVVAGGGGGGKHVADARAHHMIASPETADSMQ